MAKYTMEFCEAVELTGGKIELANENETGHSRIIGGSIDLNNYPIFDESYRARLNGLIIDTYYNSEIGHETVGIFNMRLRAHLNTHMPTFNRMYNLEMLDIDPLKTVDMKTVAASTGAQTTQADGKAENSTSSGTRGRSVYSDLPQTMLQGNEDYATNATDGNSTVHASGETSETSETKNSSESDSDSQTVGYSGSPAELVAIARESLANIDMLVLDSLTELFMGIW